MSKKRCSIWSMTRPQLTDISPAEVRQEEDVERELAAAEEGFAAIAQQLQGTRLILRLQGNRRHNSTNLLLALPLAVLRTIILKADNEARLVCSTLRDAYGTPGTGVLLPHSSTDAPTTSTPTTTSFVNYYLRSWPLASDVTQLRALSFLPASTCEALSATFPSLQALSILGGMESFSSLDPVGITNLVLAFSPPLWQLGQRKPLWGCCRHLSALRSLTLTGCTSQSLLADLSPLSALTQLTSLSLLASEGCEAADGGHSEYGAACNLSVWGVLAALPELARVHLDVRCNYRSDLPAVPALPALTHLAVVAEETMIQRDALRGVEVPFVRVLDLLPALMSLALVLGEWPWRETGSPGQRLLMQDLQQRSLVALQLPPCFGALTTSALAAALTPSLTHLKAAIALPPGIQHGGHFPAPPPLRSLDITCSITRSHLNSLHALACVLTGLSELTRLRLHLDPRWQQQRGPDVNVPSLANLANLQQLHISGLGSMALVGAFLALPSLTRLELPEVLPEQHASVLGPLSGGLRSLHLGWLREPSPVERWAAATRAVGGMRGLTELVLGPCEEAGPRQFDLLLPVPRMLRRLVVADAGARREALRVLGADVDEICVGAPAMVAG